LSTDFVAAEPSTFVPQLAPVLPGTHLARLEEAASRRGYAAGYAIGARAAREEAALLAEQEERRTAEHAERTGRARRLLDAAVRSLTERTVPVVAEAQAATVAGALDLAEAIVGVQLGDREHAARAALARATSHAHGATVAVRLHPDDMGLLAGSGAADVTLVPDVTLLPGDAVAELEHGFLDARVRTAVERARDALGTLGEAPGPVGGDA
jgi:flagellar assembly protein FliH